MPRRPASPHVVVQHPVDQPRDVLALASKLDDLRGKLADMEDTYDEQVRDGDVYY